MRVRTDRMPLAPFLGSILPETASLCFRPLWAGPNLHFSPSIALWRTWAFSGGTQGC